MAIIHGRKDVAVAGTDEALAAAQGVRWVIVEAARDNTAPVTIGGAGVDGATATRTGVSLNPGDKVFFAQKEDGDLDLADVFIDVQVGGEAVTFAAGVVD